jgi:hypothetical protein
VSLLERKYSQKQQLMRASGTPNTLKDEMNHAFFWAFRFGSSCPAHCIQALADEMFPSPEATHKLGAKLGAKTINAYHSVSIRMDKNALVGAQPISKACVKSSSIQAQWKRLEEFDSPPSPPQKRGWKQGHKPASSLSFVEFDSLSK